MEGHVLMTKVQAIDASVVCILTTSYSSVENIIEAIRADAFDYLPKPCRADTLEWVLKRASHHRTVLLENIRYREHMEQLVEECGQALEAARHHLEYSYQFMLESMVSLLEAREPLTGMHTKRVTRMAVVLGEAMGLEGDALENIRRGACLHDVGKIAIPDAILLKPGPLDEAEWKVMKAHVDIGYNLLLSNAYMRDVAEIVHSHHEWYDGSGYPRGLKGEAICLGARIFAVIDAYDAIHSKRTYSEATSIEKTLAEIQRCSGTQFDPTVVASLMANGDAVENAWLEFAESGSPDTPKPA
jgi:putative nucleotidyltransferase with HDIG domain